MLEDVNLNHEGDAWFGEMTELSDGSFEQPVFYQHEDTVKYCLAIGEDPVDVKRDWAYEFLDIFGENEHDPDVDEEGDDELPEFITGKQ